MGNIRCKNCAYCNRNITKLIQDYDKNYSYDYLWCDKVGGNIHYLGSCSDSCYNSDKMSKNHFNRSKKKKNKRERDLKYKIHLKQLYKDIGNLYPTPVMNVNNNYSNNKNIKQYYKRLYRGKCSRYLKRQSHKKVRRYNGELHVKGNSSNKIYDFWVDLC